MFRKLYNMLWGYRGKIFHVYYSMYRQNKALHMRFNDLEDQINKFTASHNSSIVRDCSMPDIICRASNKRKPGRPRRNK